MENLAKIVFILLFTISCGKKTNPEDVKVTIKLKNDTYISSKSNTDHSSNKYLFISKNDSKEERMLFRLPTNDDGDDFFDDCFDSGDLCKIFFLPVYIVTKILSTCDELSAENLTSAIFILNTKDGSSITAGDLKIQLLDKPWWHTVTWKRAHPFSTKGSWNKSGGDIDDSLDFENNCENLSEGACAADEIKFEMTEYFRKVLKKEKNTHYGLIVRSNGDLDQSKIYGVQAKSEKSPRIDATYTCDEDEDKFLPRVQKKVYYLGSKP